MRSRGITSDGLKVRSNYEHRPKSIRFHRAAPPLDGFGIGAVYTASEPRWPSWTMETNCGACSLYTRHTNVDVERGRGRARTGTLSFEDSFVLPAAWLAGANGRSKSHLRRSPALPPRPSRAAASCSLPSWCSGHPWRSSSHGSSSLMAPRRPNFLRVRRSWRGPSNRSWAARRRLVHRVASRASDCCPTLLGNVSFRNRPYFVDRSTLIETKS